MEVYVEFKPCYKTARINGSPVLPENDFWSYREHIIDGECRDKRWHITKDCKYIYGFYNGYPTFLRITNISSKPILYNFERKNKVEEWFELTRQINFLKSKRRRLLESSKRSDTNRIN
ncbi:MAG: hypothetical protein IJA10_11365 [Lachnospiraceae bacterium]|nr:hypothetical protein [Lachnospiraceae bacterium]